MKEEDGVKLSQTLYARAEKIWPRYLCHPFVTQMADGTLPPEKFRQAVVEVRNAPAYPDAVQCPM